jgi:hypothetical protein
MTFIEKEWGSRLPHHFGLVTGRLGCIRLVFKLRIFSRLQPQRWQRRTQSSAFRNHVAVLTDTSAAELECRCQTNKRTRARMQKGAGTYLQFNSG